MAVKPAKAGPRAGMPYAEMPLAEYLDKQIAVQQSLGKSQRQIATETGYDKPNMISMFKRGEAKVPLDRVPALAKSLNVDPALVFRLAMMQYWPNLQPVIAEIFGTVLTDNERRMIEVARAATKGEVPEITRAREVKIRDVFRD